MPPLSAMLLLLLRYLQLYTDGVCPLPRSGRPFFPPHKLQLQKQEIKKAKEKERHAKCQRTQRDECKLTKHSGSARQHKQ